MNQNKLFYILGILALAAVIFGLAWAEQMTLTTYYPAPYGVYKEFTTTSKTILASNDNTVDPEANVGIGTTIPTEKLYVSGKIYATDDVCIDAGSEEQTCLRDEIEGRGWYFSGDPIYTNAIPPSTWTPIDLHGWVGENRALVLLKIMATDPTEVAVRPGSDSHSYMVAEGGTTRLRMLETGQVGTVVTVTDDSGSIEWKAGIADKPVNIWLLGYSK